MNKCIQRAIRVASLGIIAWAFCFRGLAQDSDNVALLHKLLAIEKDTIAAKEKLQQVIALKKRFDDARLIEDSVYAKILHRLGQLEYSINDEVATTNSITYTLAAAKINGAGKFNSSPASCVNHYTNLGRYYRSLQLYGAAAQYYDSAIIYRKRFSVPNINELILLSAKGQMLYDAGDYQKALEAFDAAVVKSQIEKDSSLLAGLLIQRAQSSLRVSKLYNALKDVINANTLSLLNKDTIEIINGMFLKADILAKQKILTEALSLFKKGIAARLKTKNYSQIAYDYTNLGYFYLEDMHNYSMAKECFLNAADYALKAKNREILSQAHLNLGATSFLQQNYTNAEIFYKTALMDLDIKPGNDIFVNVSAMQLNAVGNKEILLFILTNKTELLLRQFTKTGDNKYLNACLKTAQLTDSIITNIRHGQLGERSKLYWREKTREFYTHAMEACWLASEHALALYFIEKSRAVLLNDRLNELKASSLLPETESKTELGYQLAVLSEQQKLAAISVDESGYNKQQIIFLQAKTNQEQYIKSLERNYPLYFQHKYSDDVPSLKMLQQRLAVNNQNFVHYFMDDSVTYVLAISPDSTRFVKITNQDFNPALLSEFLTLCSSEPATTNEYTTFNSMSYSLYKTLFEPLRIPKGRVIICPDFVLVPFEALSNENGFLLNDYIFSYVYSARYYMTLFTTYPSKGNFVGFAPVSFSPYLDMPDLKPSGEALKQSARHYENSNVFIREQATRNKFISTVSTYAVVNIFSHANADTSENEPVLYMQDSTISLSELQLLHNPATQLVVLSACQTNIGRNAKGEGIFSLARGFTLAGVPSVAATMWKADEESIYVIAEKFHEFLSAGMPKDEALQKAKLHFITNSAGKTPFPYYWANMILVGNQDAIKLSNENHVGWWIAGVIIIAAFVFFLVKKKHKHSLFPLLTFRR